MINISGYFLRLESDRYKLLCEVEDEYDSFAEPVPDFEHSRNIPLICLIAKKSGSITHIGLGKKGNRAGTDLSRLNISSIYRLKTPIQYLDISNSTDNRVRVYLLRKSESGGYISFKSFEKFLISFQNKSNEVIPVLNKFSWDRKERIKDLPYLTKRNLANQKEAVLTAMSISGIDRECLQGWDYNSLERVDSYLDGIQQIKSREDSLIINDLMNFPGFELIKNTKYSSAVFRKNETILTILMANRLPLEELTGTDLIYFNEDLKSFIMVQYKMLERENGSYVFRLPNSQISEEISRMDSILITINNKYDNGSIKDYRINENPFFIKFCPRFDFRPDDIGLSKGWYLPLDYFKRLQNDLSIIGKNGGKKIDYSNVGRYLDNTSFKAIIENGWIGTNSNQSELLQNIIKYILENGKSAVIAIRKKHEYEENQDLN